VSAREKKQQPAQSVLWEVAAREPSPPKGERRRTSARFALPCPFRGAGCAYRLNPVLKLKKFDAAQGEK
jgi:hypothetical protein